MHFNSWGHVTREFSKWNAFLFYKIKYSEGKDDTKYKSLSFDLKSTSFIKERLVISTIYKTTMKCQVIVFEMQFV